jgi:hypothetical protein
MRATHYIVGYEYDHGPILLRVEAYYKDYESLLLEDLVSNYVNEGHGFSRGIDVFLKGSLGPLHSRLSYSYLVAKRYYMEFDELTSPDFDITNNLTAVFDYTLGRSLGMSASYRYATGKPYTPGPGEQNSLRVPDYQKLDLNLTYLRSLYQGNLTVFYLGVSNLTGRVNVFDYLYSPDWSEREAVTSSFGRSYYFGVSVSL